MSAPPSERRRYARCQMEIGMTLALLNKTEEFAILTKNYSRCGIYFEARRDFRYGSVIVLRPLNCADRSGRPGDGVAPFFCTGEPPESQACRELRFPTVARVIRCNRLDIPGRERYGVAADNLRLTD